MPSARTLTGAAGLALLLGNPIASAPESSQLPVDGQLAVTSKPSGQLFGAEPIGCTFDLVAVVGSVRTEFDLP